MIDTNKKGHMVKSTCGMCYGACGVLVQVENQKAIKIIGDPESPINRGTICPKARASLELCYHPNRLRRPLRRTGAKGEGEWKQISWEEALDTIAFEFQKLRTKDQAKSIAFIQGAAKGLIDDYNERFANLLGTPNFTSTGNVCFLPRLFASQTTCGSFTVPDYENTPACIVVWGANLVETRIGEHKKTVDCLRKGTQLIVIDPVRTFLAKKSTSWLQIRPGADLALALGWIHVIIRDGLYDESFVKNHTIGFNRLKGQVASYTPKKTAQISWVDPETIITSARLYAKSSPAAIQWGNAVDHGLNSFQTARAIVILRAITGNIDVPGGDVIPSYPLAGPESADISLRHRLPQKTWETRVDANSGNYPGFRRILPGPMTTAMLDHEPYPIRCAYVHAANPMLTHTNATKLYHALKNLDFMVVSDFFMTPTAALADIVLPAATFLEYDCIVAPPYYPYAQVQQKAVEIPDCKSDFEIKNALAKRLGMADDFYMNIEDMLNDVLKPAQISFDTLREQGYITGKKCYKKYLSSGFETASGKIELYSETLRQSGFMPLPEYIEPPETAPSNPVLAKQYPLLLTTKKSISYLHSCGRQIPLLRNNHPDPNIMIHPETAARYDIGHNDMVFIETKRGRIKQKAVLSDKIDPRVICADFGWWFPEEISGQFQWRRSNINILTDDEGPFSPETGSANLRGFLCRIEKAHA